MNLSACKLIGSLSVFALMLVSVSCEGKEGNEGDQRTQFGMRIGAILRGTKMSEEECAKELAEKLAEISVPESLQELVAHMNDYQSKVDSHPNGKIKYEPIKHPDAACKELMDIFKNTVDKIYCLDRFDGLPESKYIEENTNAMATIVAMDACRVNFEKQPFYRKMRAFMDLVARDLSTGGDI